MLPGRHWPLASPARLPSLLSCCPAGRNLFGPLLKTLVVESDEPAEALGGREALISAIDRRLRFLAADSRATLRGRWPAYREVRCPALPLVSPGAAACCCCCCCWFRLRWLPHLRRSHAATHCYQPGACT